MSDSFDDFTGKIIINAQFIAQDGQAENFVTALKEVQKYALSDKEPGIYMTQIPRSGNHFLVFEEYKNSAAILEHRSTPPYRSLASQAGDLETKGSRKVVFYEEA